MKAYNICKGDERTMTKIHLNTSPILAVNRPVVIIHETNSGGTQCLTQFVREAQAHFTGCFL